MCPFWSSIHALNHYITFFFDCAHRLNDKLFRNSLKCNFYFIIVDVSASTEAFVGAVCLIAVRRSVSGRTGCTYGRVGKTPRLCSLH